MYTTKHCKDTEAATKRITWRLGTLGTTNSRPKSYRSPLATHLQNDDIDGGCEGGCEDGNNCDDFCDGLDV